MLVIRLSNQNCHWIGGLFGKGFLNGSQSYLDYLPEKHTDFIFNLFSEEFGFLGSIFILLLYVLIILRIINIGNLTRSNFGSFTATVLPPPFYLCNGKHGNGFRSTTHCWCTPTYTVVWGIFNDGHYARLRYSNVLQNIQRYL